MAASVSRLCHVAFHVPRGQGLASDLVTKFRFRPVAVRETARARQLAVRRGAAVFVVNERGEAAPSSGPTWPAPAQGAAVFVVNENPAYAVSTACNVCFELDDVPGASRRLRDRGCRLAVPPTEVTDEDGSVTYSVVRSVVGNVSHTLLDRSRYRGPFLPGFRAVTAAPEGPPDGAEITHVDHITYACPRGSARAVLDWYESCFGFRRFLLHGAEDAGEGYVIRGRGVGLRLMALQGGRAEPALPADGCRLVLAESLPEQGPNQVDTFLAQHGGAGVQHIGLYTTDIVSTAQTLAAAGVRFVEPPRAYYSEAGKTEEIRGAGQDPGALARHGILLDAELAGESPSARRYLMQIFTKPFFPEETFFLELIERRGASGFGEGNIRALWKSVQGYMDQQQ
ncbi:PREDICTED: 4-hydroxyphenylpyruvate dioxygenase-like protein [Gavialis gangeticus]|uniref:4-hydroxyphenylpyruvate dioxygenase-like protein n=1 Tax=Gavialis gangeticus TaxID=94835 RepID=UPI00092FB797|nr:PREDICTED: 4-hydroxyphenylpyruvate dioxygenase-like protein [Gavialis gangeticus]